MTFPFYLKNTDSRSPLLLSSPHSGREDPEDFVYTCPRKWIQKLCDPFVDELIEEVPATCIAAKYVRSYIDLNRAEDDFDLALVRGTWPVSIKPSLAALKGMGVVRRIGAMGVSLYDKPLTVEEVQARFEKVYRPYHERLEIERIQKREDFGKAVLIDCHSMPSSAVDKIKPQPDFVLGDREGTSCAPDILQAVKQGLENLGYIVVLNDPYKGAEILRRHGKPEEDLHAVQMEINRHLYMDESTMEKAEGFSMLQKNLTEFFTTFVEALR